MKKNKRAHRLLIYLLLMGVLISSGFLIYKKINYQKPIAAKLVLQMFETTLLSS